MGGVSAGYRVHGAELDTKKGCRSDGQLEVSKTSDSIVVTLFTLGLVIILTGNTVLLLSAAATDASSPRVTGVAR